MPSFSNGNGNYHFYLNLAHKSQSNPCDYNILLSFLKYMIISILFGLLMHSWHFIWDYFDANNYDEFFGPNRWYFEFDIILVLWQSMLIVTLSQTLISTRYPYNSFYKMFLFPHKYKHEYFRFFFYVFLSTLLGMTPVFYLTFYAEHTGRHPIWNHDDAICDWLLCDYIYGRFLLIYCLFPGTLPIIIFISWYIYYICYLKQKITAIDDNVGDLSAIDVTLLDEQNPNINIPISANDRSNSSNWSLLRLDIQMNKDRSYKLRYPLALLTLWCISFIISFLFGYIHGDPINQYFELIYYTFSVYTITFKFMMKKMARRCDFYRTEISQFNYVISIEYFMEFYWSLTYWMIYRFYTVFHAPSIATYSLTLGTHLFWEFCAVLGRFHQLYFYKTNNLITKHYKYLHHFHDGHDCTLKIWRDRLSMDLVIKLWCAIFSGIFFAVDYFIALGMYADQLKDHAPVSKVTTYLGVATAVEFIFYVATIQFGKYALNYNIMIPWVYYVKRLTRSHVIMTLIIYGCIVIPVY